MATKRDFKHTTGMHYTFTRDPCGWNVCVNNPRYATTQDRLLREEEYQGILKVILSDENWKEIC